MSFIIDSPRLGVEGDRGLIGVCNGKVLFRQNIHSEDRQLDVLQESDFEFQVSELSEIRGTTLYLGRYFDRAFYVKSISDEDAIPPGCELIALKPLLPRVETASFSLFSRALQLVKWDGDHRFCGHCGTETERLQREHARSCPNCHLLVYPRISPCIMALVRRGDRILLGRGFNFPEGVYSALAGFVESGENLEQAVAREIKEETGITVNNLRYYGSQNWPFPAQLMIGFTADYHDGDLVPDGVEIEDVGWFSIDDLPLLPAKQSLSGQMITKMTELIKTELRGS
jgi:NAD+ diphosphatase